MKRREFLATSAAAAAALGATAAANADDHADKKDHGGKFKLKYAPSPGQFKHHAGDDYLDQIQFAADQGFRGWEDNGLPRRDPKLQEAVGKKLADNGMTMGVFVSVSADMAMNANKETRDKLTERMTGMLDVAKRCGAKWTTVVPGAVTQKIHMDYQTANVIDNLRALSEVCEPSGLIMVLEPLNWWANHPGRFLQEIPQAYSICKAVGSPSCKILDDLYHQQITEGNLIPNLDAAWDEIAYFQIGDNPGRREPTTGEINYGNVFQHIWDRGFRGILGMEHGNAHPGAEGERAVIDAYRSVDAMSG
ncbi:MAG: hydroxypyruvate isomerase family protein [Phycisphaeraceae bacterium]